MLVNYELDFNCDKVVSQEKYGMGKNTDISFIHFTL